MKRFLISIIIAASMMINNCGYGMRRSKSETDLLTLDLYNINIKEKQKKIKPTIKTLPQEIYLIILSFLLPNIDNDKLKKLESAVMTTTESVFVDKTDSLARDITEYMPNAFNSSASNAIKFELKNTIKTAIKKQIPKIILEVQNQIKNKIQRIRSNKECVECVIWKNLKLIDLEPQQLANILKFVLICTPKGNDKKDLLHLYEDLAKKINTEIHSTNGWFPKDTKIKAMLIEFAFLQNNHALFNNNNISHEDLSFYYYDDKCPRTILNYLIECNFPRIFKILLKKLGKFDDRYKQLIALDINEDKERLLLLLNNFNVEQRQKNLYHDQQNNNIVANKDNIVFHFFKTLCGTPIKGATYLVKGTYNVMLENSSWKAVAFLYFGVPYLALFGGWGIYFFYNGTYVGYFPFLKSTAMSLASYLPFVGKYFEKSQYPCDTGTVCLNQNAENLFTNTCPNQDYQVQIPQQAQPQDSTWFSWLKNLKFGRQQQNQAVAGKQVDHEEIDQAAATNNDEPAVEEVPNPDYQEPAQPQQQDLQTKHERIGGWLRDHLF